MRINWQETSSTSDRPCPKEHATTNYGVNDQSILTSGLSPAAETDVHETWLPPWPVAPLQYRRRFEPSAPGEASASSDAGFKVKLTTHYAPGRWHTIISKTAAMAALSPGISCSPVRLWAPSLHTRFWAPAAPQTSTAQRPSGTVSSTSNWYSSSMSAAANSHQAGVLAKSGVLAENNQICQNYKMLKNWATERQLMTHTCSYYPLWCLSLY